MKYNHLFLSYMIVWPSYIQHKFIFSIEHGVLGNNGHLVFASIC